MAEKTVKESHLDKRRFWKVHIQAWERSGFTQTEYCHRNNLRSNQFTYWKTKFNREHEAPVNFVPVPTNPTHQVTQSLDSRDSGLSVLLGRVEIKIANNFNPACLSKVVSILKERP